MPDNIQDLADELLSIAVQEIQIFINQDGNHMGLINNGIFPETIPIRSSRMEIHLRDIH